MHFGETNELFLAVKHKHLQFIYFFSACFAWIINCAQALIWYIIFFVFF